MHHDIRKIIYVVNVDWFFITHRLPLVHEAMLRGYVVYLVSKDTGRFDELKSIGINCIGIDFDRAGKNPFKEFAIFRELKKIYREIKPDIIHHVTIKPSIYGTIAANAIRSKARIINAISGMGYTFTRNRRSLGKSILLFLMQVAFKDRKSNFIFQNPDDKLFYEKLNFLNNYNSIIIKGSGVDENIFSFSVKNTDSGIIKIVLVARMLKDKGVLEFIKAAKILKNSGHESLQFLLVGGLDPENPAHIAREELLSEIDGNYIQWLGHKDNIKEIYDDSDIVCLPSYREGLPKSLVEAMAIGRPIITTNAIGCKECVEEGINGYIVPPGDYIVLAERISSLAADKNLRLSMGIKSRELMLKDMSLEEVVKRTFEFYA